MTADEVVIIIRRLETALARGESKVDFADRSVSYRSIDEILKALAYFKGLLRTLNGQPKQSIGVGTSGFDRP